jgi:hypothetical protein
MADYRVAWEIDIEADSPDEAACEAMAIQRNPESTASIFTVRWRSKKGEYWQKDVDLEKLDNPE